LEILKSGRVSAIIAAMPDMSAHLDTIHFDSAFVLGQLSDEIHCFSSAEAGLFIEKLNDGIKQLNDEGVIKKILGVRYLDE
jgi:hypothetical protein